MISALKMQLLQRHLSQYHEMAPLHSVTLASSLGAADRAQGLKASQVGLALWGGWGCGKASLVFVIPAHLSLAFVSSGLRDDFFSIICEVKVRSE